MLSIIVAMAANRVIGNNNALPWHLPADLRHFRAVTMGKPIVMGRKTWESIGRPLPGRTSIVITRNTGFRADGCVVVNSIDAALAAAGDVPEVMVIGGAELYRQVLPRADRIYLTRIADEFPGDATFPQLDASEWDVAGRTDHAADDSNPHDYSFLILERLRD